MTQSTLRIKVIHKQTSHQSGMSWYLLLIGNLNYKAIKARCTSLDGDYHSTETETHISVRAAEHF